MKEKLRQAVINNKNKLLYININENNQYIGWASNFNIKLPNGKYMKLNLSNEYYLFLLFVLASSWSKTGPWKNAALFTTYLKISNKDNVGLWLDDNFINEEIQMREHNAKATIDSCTGITRRKK